MGGEGAVRPRCGRGPCAAGPPGSRDRPWCACAAGSRASCGGDGCSAGRYACSLETPVRCCGRGSLQAVRCLRSVRLCGRIAGRVRSPAAGARRARPDARLADSTRPDERRQLQGALRGHAGTPSKRLDRKTLRGPRPSGQTERRAT